MEETFRFKEFSIAQDRTAMKVGTDGVLLGAWADVENADSILDIGAGTGLIALMLAQRSGAGLIDAIEIESKAYEQTVENFENSPWGDRLFCYHGSVQELSRDFDEKYDLIISNPPYFNPSKNNSAEREIARQHVHLTFEELLNCTALLLSENGSCAFVIPFSEEETFLEIAERHKLFPGRITRVKGTMDSPVKRSLLQLSSIKKEVAQNELIIEKSRHHYTAEFTDLVKDFYLKM